MNSAQIFPATEAPLPLCVDLDGTLIRTDTLLESVLLMLKRNPLLLFMLPLWLLRGRACLKQQIARRVTLDAPSLPYNLEFLKYLTEEHRAGRRLVLATAADRRLALQVADYLALFSEVIASDGVHNLAGEHKLQRLIERFGPQQFDYAGNAAVDLSIWRQAAHAIVVHAPERIAARVPEVAAVREVFPAPHAGRHRIRIFLKAIRIHQWVKNALLFVPLMTSHHWADVADVLRDVYAFFAFSLCSSGVYLLNDLLDLEADRAHTTKCKRPLASGDLPLGAGMLAIPALFAGSAVIAGTLLPPSFGIALSAYLVLTMAYSFYLKQIALLDVLVLALLYTTRIAAGATAIHVVLSQWLLAFSMFLFLSLALVKRFSELREIRASDRHAAKGRGYLAADLEQLASLGAASGYISVLVLALYINSHQVMALYQHPKVLWLICPLILYWISRVWLLAHRGQMHQDPIVFALRDKASYSLALASAVIMILAV